MIKKSELEKMLHVNERSIDSYVDQGILPIPSYPTYPETEMLFDRDVIAKMLGIKEIPNEPFIETSDAAKILGMSEEHTHRLSRIGRIPSYRLKNVRGHKVLFLKSEIEALMKCTFEWSADFANFFSKQFFLKSIFNELLKPSIAKDLKPNEFKVMKEVIMNNKSLEDISKEIGLTRERTRQIFQTACKRIYFRVKGISSQLMVMDSFISENTELKEENRVLRSLLNENKVVTDKKIIDVLKIKIEDLGLSRRVMSIFKSVDILTMGDIVKYSKGDLVKFRSFGAICLTEVEKVVAKYGLKFASEKIFVQH